LMGKQTVYGDIRYDMAKIAHSVYGLYDFIISGIVRADMSQDYKIDFNPVLTSRISMVQDVFARLSVGGVHLRSRQIQAITILLFLSMLPLHAEDERRQNTLLANAFRLYFDIQKGSMFS